MLNCFSNQVIFNLMQLEEGGSSTGDLEKLTAHELTDTPPGHAEVGSMK